MKTFDFIVLDNWIVIIIIIESITSFIVSQINLRMDPREILVKHYDINSKMTEGEVLQLLLQSIMLKEFEEENEKT